MGRIRTIKPEAPQSESLGRCSRDARLLFFMLFTIADDEGRGRAASRLLASLLFPYDDDAAIKIPEWLLELERENCLVVYCVDGNTYFQITNWAAHQKIDKATKSKLPAPPEKRKSRERATKPREGSSVPLDASSQYQGREGIKDQGGDQGVDDAPQAALADDQVVALNKVIAAKGTRWPSDARVPSDWFEDAAAQCRDDGYPIPDLRREAGKFERYWSSKAGAQGRKADWRKTFINWAVKAAEDEQNKRTNSRRESPHEQTERIARELARESQAGDEGRDFGTDRRARIALPGVLADDG